MKNQRNNILVPVDGSQRSLATVRYVGKMIPLRNMRVTLFHIFSGVPEYYWDLSKEPKSIRAVPGVRAWQREQEKRIEAYMLAAKGLLVKSGFAPQGVIVKIQQRKKGFARDIIREAQQGYRMVITRRRGATGLRGIVLGSVATKLLQGLSQIPLVLVGKQPPGKKILIAFDGSVNALRAVDFVGAMLGGYDYKLCLIHVVRSKAEVRSAAGGDLFGRDQAQAQKEITDLLNQAKTRLFDSGFQPDQVKSLIVAGVLSRAAAITAVAKREGFATIVMGRRGLSMVHEFFIGRVTSKVVHLDRDRTVWIVR